MALTLCRMINLEAWAGPFPRERWQGKWLATFKGELAQKLNNGQHISIIFRPQASEESITTSFKIAEVPLLRKNEASENDIIFSPPEPMQAHQKFFFSPKKEFGQNCQFKLLDQEPEG